MHEMSGRSFAMVMGTYSYFGYHKLSVYENVMRLTHQLLYRKPMSEAYCLQSTILTLYIQHSPQALSLRR